MKKALVLAAITSVALGCSAQAKPVDNFIGLETAARVSPSDGGAQTELASAYYRAGRTSDAAAAYRRVLALDNEMLETRTGNTIWSHQVARYMLQKTAATTLTSR